MHDETPAARPPTPKADAPPLPTEAELSRIAREAVHQPPDARLDKQLARMGLLDDAGPAGPQPGAPTSGGVAIDPELDRLRDQLRRARLYEWLLVGVIVVLTIVVVVLLLAR